MALKKLHLKREQRKQRRTSVVTGAPLPPPLPRRLGSVRGADMAGLTKDLPRRFTVGARASSELRLASDRFADARAAAPSPGASEASDGDAEAAEAPAVAPPPPLREAEAVVIEAPRFGGKGDAVARDLAARCALLEAALASPERLAICDLGLGPLGDACAGV